MLERPGREEQTDSLTAYERYKRHLVDWIAIGVILSVGVHYALFTLFPELRAADIERGGRAITAVKLPPVVQVPPPPEFVARPAVPKVAATDVAEDVTIAPTTFEANPVENLAPPPVAAALAHTEEDRPRFIPYDTPPRLLNASEIQRLLQERYPVELREARLEGRVVIWAYVDINGEVGTVRVQESSGLSAMDRVALEVARQMRFSPARNRDKKTPVWVQQAIQFTIK